MNFSQTIEHLFSPERHCRVIKIGRTYVAQIEYNMNVYTVADANPKQLVKKLLQVGKSHVPTSYDL